MAEVMDDGYTLYTPGVQCIHCGRFVGRDGSLAYEYFEMSSTIASLDGECRRCLDRERAAHPERFVIRNHPDPDDPARRRRTPALEDK